METKPKNKLAEIGKTILGIIILIIMVLNIYTYFNGNKSNYNSRTDRDREIDRQLTEIASQFNENAPFMIDENTRFDNMIATPGKILQYNYTLVDMTKEEFDEYDEEYDYIDGTMLPMIINQLKTHPQMERFRKMQITLRSYYRDMNGVYITELEVTPSMYND